jgi:hypothetical protein
MKGGFRMKSAIGTIKVEKGKMFPVLFPKLKEGAMNKWSPFGHVHCDENAGLIKIYVQGDDESVKEFLEASNGDRKLYRMIRKWVKISSETIG